MVGCISDWPHTYAIAIGVVGVWGYYGQVTISDHAVWKILFIKMAYRVGRIVSKFQLNK